MEYLLHHIVERMPVKKFVHETNRKKRKKNTVVLKLINTLQPSIDVALIVILPFGNVDIEGCACGFWQCGVDWIPTCRRNKIWGHHKDSIHTGSVDSHGSVEALVSGKLNMLIICDELTLTRPYNKFCGCPPSLYERGIGKMVKHSSFSELKVDSD